MSLVRELFSEYEAGLGFSLCFQDFEKELAALPGEYAPPEDSLLLAFSGDEPAGYVALRLLKPVICEMTRLYVRQAFRGAGLGCELAAAIVHEARVRGYSSMSLDTVPSLMPAAVRLYRSLGFVDIEPYNVSPSPEIQHLELSL